MVGLAAARACWAHPRSRGENAPHLGIQANGPGSSPLMRGKPEVALADCVPVRLIPTHAGKTFVSHLYCAARGSSPLTRGKRRARHSCSARRRLIPAHAGKTRVALNQAPFARAHPRSRGENFVRSRARLIGLGSSPLTRGKHDRELRRRHVPGLIPAHAGKTLTPAGQLVIDGGSSPLTRGKQTGRDGGSRRTGLIPAHAGKTSRRGDGRCPRRAHPRSRGENLLMPAHMPSMKGSSPLTRGKLFSTFRRASSAGLIPAHAGKTVTHGPPPRPPAAHPRSRGENSARLAVTVNHEGSSPLTRGKPRRAGY